MMWLDGWGDLFAVAVWIERFIRFRGSALWFNMTLLSVGGSIGSSSFLSLLLNH
jgi:hypothetical protein